MIAGLEAWESLILWCSEMTSSNPDIPYADIVKGNSLVRTHLYAGFLYYNGSWNEAVGVYRKAAMYRYIILLII
jgi:hypothetical protein